MNASFGIYFPKFVGTIYELLSAPVSPFEAVTAYVGAAASKSIILAVIMLITALEVYVQYYVGAAPEPPSVAPESAATVPTSAAPGQPGGMLVDVLLQQPVSAPPTDPPETRPAGAD